MSWASGPIPQIMYGWPLNALVISADWPRHMDAPTSWRHGVRVSNLPAAVSLHGEVRMPIRPLWFGSVANSVCFAMVLCLLMGILGGVRRATRRSRGRCPNCAYDLQGAEHKVCPECGTAIAEVKPVQ